MTTREGIGGPHALLPILSAPLTCDGKARLELGAKTSVSESQTLDPTAALTDDAKLLTNVRKKGRPDARLSANVRKKGRPSFLTDESRAFLRSVSPEMTYRQHCGEQKFLHVAKVLIGLCDEKSLPAVALNGVEFRPESVKRFPWLLGQRIQHTVLAELYGLPCFAIIIAADILERDHQRKQFNAKVGRGLARSYKQAIFSAILEQAAADDQVANDNAPEAAAPVARRWNDDKK